MSDEFHVELPLFITRLQREWRVASPVSSPATIASVAIEEEVAGETYLVLTFTSPARPRHMLEGTIERVGTNDLVVRAWVWPELSAQLYFEDRAFDHVRYVVEGSIDPAAGLATDQSVSPSAEFPATATTLKLGFYADTPAGPRYIHPATVLRTFSLFDPGVTSLLHALLALDPLDPFFLDAFLAHVDDQVDRTTSTAGVMRYLLFNEYEHVRRVGLPLGSDVLGAYESRFEDYLSDFATIAELEQLIESPTALADAIAASPDRFRLWRLPDKHLWLLLVDAADVGIDPIYVDTGFVDLWDTQRDRLFVVQRYLAIFNGPFSAVPSARGFAGFPFPAENRTKFRAKQEVDDEIGGIFNQEKVRTFRARRYHFRQGLDKNVQFGLGPLPDSTSTSPFATGCDDLIPVIVDGTPVAPEANKDVKWAAETESFSGTPIFGRAVKHGTPYFFWLGRENQSVPDLPGAEARASYGEMVSLLQTLAATEAMFTDGGDSIGLMVKDRGVVPGLEPGPRKNRQNPIAIGFRRLA